MLKPICVTCQRFFRMEKCGFYFIEGMPKTDSPQPGKAEPESWKPYKLWVGDMWKCQGCGAEIIVGTGRSRIAEHYEADFEKKVKALGASQLQVNDC